MRTTFALLALSAAIAAPLAASAAPVDASMVPDGTYTVKVEKIQDAEHILVQMNNGIETVLSSRGPINFARVKVNDVVKISLVAGKVPVYSVQ